MNNHIKHPEVIRDGLLTEFKNDTYMSGLAMWNDTTENHNIGRGNVPLFPEFDGVTDVVLVPSIPSTPTMTTGTIECWINRDNTGAANQGVIGQYLNWAFWLSGGNLMWTDYANFTNHNCGYIPHSEWHHIVATFEDLAFQASTGTVNIYIDGANVLTTTGGHWHSATTTAIGALTTFWFYNGKLNEARIYNKALSADEVMNNYRCGEGGYHG